MKTLSPLRGRVLADKPRVVRGESGLYIAWCEVWGTEQLPEGAISAR